ncbi:hypothetical protein RB653_002259 [Dictyostelium firmibasis]|uniref:Uncharacterized protein n=1 Tax=Dictyostelium firmibasis TaxID=79012 RepID=A0AAN7TX50_9MYCE
MNDQKEQTNIIKPKLSQEMDSDKGKVFSFESNNSKVFTYENGQLVEKNEASTITKGDNLGSVTERTEKHTEFNNENPKGKTISKSTTTYNGYDTKTPFNTPNQQYQPIEGDNTNSGGEGLGLKELHKNPNVGNEQYFTSFQKYLPKENNNNNESLPK